jgi:DNA-binding GntR family transcriptional regulator
LKSDDSSSKRGQLRVARQLSNVSQIHDEIRRLILRGSFEPGTRLSQIGLAKRLRVGLTPLREALRMLQQEGLIVAEHNKRPRLLNFEPDTIDTNFAEVIVLASLAAAVSVPRLTDEDISAIGNALKEMGIAARRANLEGWMEADERFHSRSFLHVGAALNRLLKRAYDEHQFYVRFMRSRKNVPWSKVHDDHEMIFQACAARDGDLAARLIARQIASNGITLLAHVMPEREPRMIRAAMHLIVHRPDLVVSRLAARP